VDKVVQVSLEYTRCNNAIKGFLHNRGPGGGGMVSIIIRGLLIGRQGCCTLGNAVTVITICIKVRMLKPIGIIRLLKIKNLCIPWGLESECDMRKRVPIIVGEWAHIHICQAMAHVEWDLVPIKGE
jgi:hypothetical protein